MSSMDTVSAALDSMFDRPEGLYGTIEEIPVISQKGHFRRVELLQRLAIGDVSRMTCADFGMGSWGFAGVFPRLHDCARAIGFDISNKAIEISKKLVADAKPKYWQRFEAYQSDGMHIPLPDESIDLFFSGESIEHVRFAPKYVNEIYRVLKPGGQVVITTPNRDAIKYKEKGEEYCTSPEHFWLFNYPELVEVVSLFFDIREAYGFNGSYGSHAEDRNERDEARAEEWCRQFEKRPDLATGIILRATKRPRVLGHYELIDIPFAGHRVEKANQYLALEFGLKGLFLEDETHNIKITRPPSDGIVCRSWCHRWSGIARVEHLGTSEEQDLYAYVPGWRNYVSRTPTSVDTHVVITPTMKKNPHAEATQVIFFEAFAWRFVGGPPPKWGALPKTEPAPPSAPAIASPVCFTPGYGFHRYQLFVGTTVFLWFSPNEGNVSGPWPPLGGRASWKGDAAFWTEQIKEMMLANIDVIFLHCIDAFQAQRHEFFKAYAEMRAQGWDTPKICPFLDPFGLFATAAIDVATPDGKDAFTIRYTQFLLDYFQHNTDADAASYLLTIDGKLALSTWWVYSLLRNIEHFTRDDVEQRLARDVGVARVPQLAHGIHMITTALIDPDLTFSDERYIMFSGYCYALHSVRNGIDAWHVQAGYWDQNIRAPGYFLPRDGGKNYKRAWNAVIGNMPNVHRVYVESWNEYDEGSGIYASDPRGMVANRSMHQDTDRWSDTDDPFEYIMTTADGAAKVNGRAGLNARLIHIGAPAQAGVGARVPFSVVARNEGNERWPRNGGFMLRVRDAESAAQCLVPLGPAVAHVAPVNEGDLFRGHPVVFDVDIAAPRRPGPWKLMIELMRADEVVPGGAAEATIELL